MSPYSSTTTTTTVENSHINKESSDKKQVESDVKLTGYFKTKILWGSAIGITLLYILSIYAMFLYPWREKWYLGIYASIYGFTSGFGITAGAHRYWCHKAYKANLPMRIFLMICFMMAGQNSIFQWVRDHRTHHKFSETDADPHDARRGFFFSHCGWLMLNKHPEVLRKGKAIDMSDVLADPVVQFEERFFPILKLVFAFVLPILLFRYMLNEEWYYAFLVNLIRYSTLLNFTWSTNSVAHLWGNRPYDKSIFPRENLFVSIFALGEGWHNYHHTFPWDYRTSEIGKWNVSAFFINRFAEIGWAYDLKTPSEQLIKKVIRRHGDGTYDWGGKEIPEEVEDLQIDKTY